MKKLVVAALLTAGVGMVTSCNNGAYDASPKTSGNPLNPLNPSSGVTVYLGNMKANIFGTTTMFYPATYRVDEAGGYIVTGVRENDPDLKHTLTLYRGSDNSTGGLFTYVDTVYHRYDSLITFGMTGKSHMTVTIGGTEDGNLRGHFSGTLYKVAPVQNLNDSVVITNGEFYVPRKQ